MAGGFNSPNILFLNTYDALDRKYIAEIVPKLQRAGYNRYVELYAGGFAMPFVVASQGMKPENMACYDISLYSSILGYTFSGQDLRLLDVCLDGEPIELTGKDACANAAILLYEQALARLEKAAHIHYFKMLVDNLNARLLVHIAKSRHIINKCLVGSSYNQYTFYLVQAKRICTVEYSRYHEVKGLRGLMKIESKKKINDELNALSYYGDLNEKTEADVLKDFLDVEERYANGKK
ncbi:MAG: hypothetical protein IJQ79_03060 [Bacteroidales bacterium]|nr:hypothetical protein [Bacteroidales bacterium]